MHVFPLGKVKTWIETWSVFNYFFLAKIEAFVAFFSEYFSYFATDLETGYHL